MESINVLLDVNKLSNLQMVQEGCRLALVHAIKMSQQEKGGTQRNNNDS